jgi:hypothetical protein
MVFEAQALAPGPGTRSTATFRAALHSSRFERFPVFHTSTSDGGYDSKTNWMSGIAFPVTAGDRDAFSRIVI